MSSTIYCYGGAKRRIEVEGHDAITNDFFLSLDLSQSTTVNDIQEAWNPIDGGVGPNYYFAMAPLPEMNSFVIDGGRGQGDGKAIAQEISSLFDVKKNQWNSHMEYIDGRIRT